MDWALAAGETLSDADAIMHEVGHTSSDPTKLAETLKHYDAAVAAQVQALLTKRKP